MAEEFDPKDWPNDYSHPNAIASEFETIQERIKELESRRGRYGETGIWVLGSSIAVVLSWSRNASILYCICHGFISWIYVIYFAFTR